MATTRRTVAMLLTLAATVSATQTLKGCYSSSDGLSYADTWPYQSSGHCVPLCVSKGMAVAGLTNGADCWCGNELPEVTAQVDNSMCSTTCNGYKSELCGGTGFWTVWLTGTNDAVTNAAALDTTSSTTSSSSTSSTSSATTTSTPSVVTSVSPGNTIVVTVSASATNTASSNSSSSGTSVAGVAAGVVVGVLALAAIIGGLFFWLRHRRRQRVEDDYKRSAQVSDFMRGASERKPPTTGYSQMSDSRLDPEAGRRNSVGSMADEQDYSRRILRVANPDSH